MPNYKVGRSQILLRVTPDTAEALDQISHARLSSRSKIIRLALVEFLERNGYRVGNSALDGNAAIKSPARDRRRTKEPAPWFDRSRRDRR